ncbi:MAG: PTS system mannose/fructose/sorbose family transporter subunit IID, partial [Deltaproteobacteria bacterium]|nr:PTS system mannose/fructose/sorbose family transporter subunit IID [Deltaproteobacteria bacterium]
MSLKWKVFLRSMMIQAGWNFERMQNIGFAFALYPALKKIWTTPQTFKQALERHMAPFNTQPYMSSFVLGMAWRLEEWIAAKAASQQLSGAALPSVSGEGPPGPDKSGESAEERRMCAVKKTASSALAAIGDTLFWGTLKPATLGICLIIWLVFGFHEWMVPISENDVIGTLPVQGSVIFAGLLAGLIVYNSFAVWVRWRGLSLGYECG